jgi:hypothetical protein
MTLAPPDYAILCSALAVAIVGAFGGFSGALAFLLASVAGGAAGKFGWGLSAHWLNGEWSRAVAVLAVSLIIFGLVRWAVRKTVSGILAQPADAIFGFLTGAVTGFALAAAAVYVLGPDTLALIAAKGEMLGYLLELKGF